jgi:hypothetical protein
LGQLALLAHDKEKMMINSLKAEIERRTGLPASTVDQVISTLGAIINERYPQYAGVIGPLLGIPTSGSAAGTGVGSAAGTSTTTPGSPLAGGAQGMPDLTGIEGEIGKFLGGHAGQQDISTQQGTASPGEPQP